MFSCKILDIKTFPETLYLKKFEFKKTFEQHPNNRVRKEEKLEKKKKRIEKLLEEWGVEVGTAASGHHGVS